MIRMKNPSFWIVGLIGFCALSMGVNECAPGPGPGPNDPQGVEGIYDITYANTIHVTLDIGGATQSVDAHMNDTIEFNTPANGKVSVNLSEYCARPEVVCPSEAFWSIANVRFPRPTESLGDLKSIQATDGSSKASPEIIDGAVNTVTGEFIVGLKAASNGGQYCGALGISAVSGRFAHDAQGHTTGMSNGKIGVAVLGACAFGPAVVGAVLTLETQFTGDRVGPL